MEGLGVSPPRIMRDSYISKSLKKENHKPTFEVVYQLDDACLFI
jgi:hypothetical protein